MKAGLRRVLALALCLGAVAAPASAATSTFTDVPSTYWGHPYITEAASKGLVSGIGDGKYGPEDTLSNAQFITMVCNMFYSNQLASQSTAGEWWVPYVTVAATQGLLNGTTAAQLSAASGWTTAIANSNISRYDMAQVMYNLAVAQKWEMPDTLSLALTQVLIQDWSTIPTGYQMAVAVCYAKGFMSGDNNSKFNGTDNSTRAQAAVVLCSLDDAKTAVTAPTYTNTNRLTNGLAATEENVADLVDDLWLDYPDNGSWDMDTTYTSQRLGVGTGDRAFVYMLSDKVFGGMPAEPIDDPADLRVGDVIAFNNRTSYGLVAEADETTFSYVTCEGNGWISWDNDMYRDDLDSGDIVYTRYLTMPEPDDVLANDKEATRANVESLMKSLKKSGDYEDGARWDWDYEYRYSDVFDEADGDEGFAYSLSDEIFGRLEVYEIDDEDDIRVGDVIYNDESNMRMYGVVIDVDYTDREYTYVSLDDYDESRGEVYWGFTGKFANLDLNRCYTRYPEDADYDRDDQEDDELTNGKAVTEDNVEKLLDDVLNTDVRHYYVDGYWELMDEYYDDSEEFRDAKGSEGFAYFISDEIFGNLKVRDVDDPEDLRVGDVIRLKDGEYAIVDSISISRGECDYYTVDEDGYWYDDTCDLDDINKNYMYTRYLTDKTSSYLDEDEVEDELYAVLDDLDHEWNMSKKHDFDTFDEYDVTGDEAFAYYVSDEIFGDRDVERLYDEDDLQSGDVIWFDDETYGVVTYTWSDGCNYVSVDKYGDVYDDDTYYEDNEIYRMYTRY